MNIFTKAALATTTALTTLVPGAMAGYNYQGVALMDGSDFTGNERLAGDMIRSLTEMGVPVVDGGKEKVDICLPDPNEGSYTLGFYVPARNLMVICTNVADKATQFETLTHEVVHVIQDARHGMENGSLGEVDTIRYNRLVDGLTQNKVHIISNFYDKEDWAVEVEAFFFQDYPEVVATELKKWAF